MPEHAVASKARAAIAPPQSKPAPRIRVHDTAHEQEADRTADATMHGGLTHARNVALPRARRRNTSVILGPGRALDDATRMFMEPRIGFDFRDVRIHDDSEAARATDLLHALAFTSGGHIAFAPGNYAPASLQGAHLLAHELTHVKQQALTPGLAGAVQLKPKPAPVPQPAPLWYQEVKDQVDTARREQDENRKKYRGTLFDDSTLPNKEALLELCEAVDQKLVSVIPKKVDALLKAGLEFSSGTLVLGHDLLTELTARMFELGLDKEADRLRSAYAKRESWRGTDDYRQRRTIAYLNRLVAGAQRDSKSDTPAEVTASIQRYARVFVLLRDEYIAIDWWEYNHEKRFGTSLPTLKPRIALSDWVDLINEAIHNWLRGLATVIQAALDLARRDLENPKPTGSGAAMLKTLRQAIVGELDPVLFPADVTKRMAGASYEITKTTIKKGSGTIADMFAEGKEAKARAVPVNTYDPEDEGAEELEASLATFRNVRIEQIDLLGRLYGVTDVIEPGKTTAETEKTKETARETAESIKRTKQGRLRLDSDDDWRAFVMQRYNDLIKPPAPTAPVTTTSPTPSPAPTAKTPLSPEDALHEIIELLFRYLRVFTIHARYTNIYDFGDTNYLNRPFPRALTGQLVQDCGVYALRVAYILSLVRNQLLLKFHFVTLPIHVALVIRGEKFGAYVVENNRFEHYTATKLGDARKEWNAYLDPATNKKPKGARDDDQFFGELAARHYVDRVDMPFRVTAVPKPVRDAKLEQKQLWESYQQITKQDLFGASTEKKNHPNYLFQLKYLELTSLHRDAYNDEFVPFWNEHAPQVWDDFKKQLTNPAQRGTPPRTSVKVKELKKLLADYQTAFADAMKAVEAEYQALNARKAAMTTAIRTDPKLVKAGTRIADGIRALGDWEYYWLIHARKIKAYEQALATRPADQDETITAVEQALQPPFVPREEKRVSPIQ